MLIYISLSFNHSQGCVIELKVRHRLGFRDDHSRKQECHFNPRGCSYPSRGLYFAVVCLHFSSGLIGSLCCFVYGANRAEASEISQVQIQLQNLCLYCSLAPLNLNSQRGDPGPAYPGWGAASMNVHACLSVHGSRPGWQVPLWANGNSWWHPHQVPLSLCFCLFLVWLH